MQGQVQIYILGIGELGKLQSGYLQVHRQDAARRAATGSALAQIDISVHHVPSHVHRSRTGPVTLSEAQVSTVSV